MKKCKRCKKIKPITEFYKHKNRPDGLHDWCKDCDKEQDIKWRKNNTHRSWALNSMKDHKRRGYKINISLEELLKMAKQTTHCFICNVKLDWSYGKEKIKINSPTLDRINNEKKINIKNTKIICYSCNTTKRHRTFDEFIKFCEMVYKKFKKNES